MDKQEIEKLEEYLIIEASREDEEFKKLSKQEKLEYLKESYNTTTSGNEDYETWLTETAKANGY